jgi:hypothetical protein
MRARPPPSPNDHPFLVLSAEDDVPLCTSVLAFGGRKPAGQDWLADCVSSQQRVILAEIPGG